MTAHGVEVQVATASPGVPDAEQLVRWARAALADRIEAELVVRVVDEAEGRELNRRYRRLDRPTNVLSFPCELPAGVPASLLGDVVICAPVVLQEAAEQGKEPDAHWAHIVVHGVLHLLGYDHQDAGQADRMEGRERAILAGLGFPDPYLELNEHGR